MITRVSPDNGAREGRYLAVAIVAILAVAALALPYHQAHTDGSHRPAHHIGIEQLPKQRLGPLRELNIAKEELQFYQQDEQRWPPVAELASEFIAPFSDDQWQWRQVESGVYLGSNGHWSLLLNAINSEIWYLNAAHSDFAGSLVHFLEQNWQQVQFNDVPSIGDND
ncbi:DUF6162 family protein [Ferrimonas sp. SCSIO 43195]|uniref:DUF6162 family protein n=1 Tax=Ferrimonas sp. SCSIO 43195 TaxID=2822844 RepID=UPI002076326A|nr:hypothetical protein [Ferrimonas sp. SCSIO 43195]USD39349.1 hypothetical protein J8Z22_09775 [Ferrimonas sp. SCSIO 43195]